MRILLVTPRYSLSGVPLAQIRLAKGLSSIGHEVKLLIGHVNEGFTMPSIDNVNVQLLGKKRAYQMLLGTIKSVNEFKPDILFSAEDHLNIIVMLASFFFKNKVKISCSSRVTPFDTYSNNLFTKRWVLKLLMRFFMNRADVLSCVSKDMVYQYKDIFKNSRHIDIYNIVQPSSENISLISSDKSWIEDASKIILGVGMLAHWKGFEDLIRAFDLIPREKNYKLLILGDGPLRNKLNILIKELNLTKKVYLKGNVSNTSPYYKVADLFVLSSYVEGLPNVLVEALSYGCTCVATNCQTGPREVLSDGLYGYLTPVGNVKELSKTILKAIDNPISIHKTMKAVEPFTLKNVLESHRKSLKIERNKFYNVKKTKNRT